MKRNSHSLILRLVALPRVVRKAMVVTLDLVLCAAVVPIAFWLRLGYWQFETVPVLIFTGIALATWVAAALATRTYRAVVRFSGRHTILVLMRACALLAAVLAVILLSLRIENVPRTLSVIHPLVLFLAISAQRMLLAQLIMGAVHGPRRLAERKRVLIYGAGSGGQQLAASMRQEPGLTVVGFVDANESLRKHLIEGKMIWHTSELELVLAMEEVDEVFLAIPSARRSVRRAIVERIRHANSKIRVRLLPTLSQIAFGRVSISDLREVQIEELLGRDEVPPDPDLMARNVAGRVVLVTGAGGSIGSELCRQIIRQGPSELILAEQSEHALYLIDSELREMCAREGLAVALRAELLNVAAPSQCERLLVRCRPDTVYHAAAYKHVPLVEGNPISGIRNNVFGTLYASLAAEKAGASKFILVSTDKAVRPTNIMGASKRVCELIVQARSKQQSQTSYSSVRFGNVLGSSGSVIPRFREQIAAGGPVTVTHHEATRYFMTIPEASQLVIQAGALAGEGEVLLLDMGQPVRIVDLARAMIELSGLSVADDDNPDGDILLEVTGLRPGEKMVEELLIGADFEGTAHPRIIKAREKMIEWDRLEPQLAGLAAFLDEADVARTLAALKRLVPEYAPPEVATADANPPAAAGVVPLHVVRG
ncbi:nucleoside-diphosphate sugar epimerase/dehydratase [Sphingomonas sp.]|uniref:polysaccharide biosynthesis protein n=1 Tax=Sphingomonas sp. TaxID=28214 RepID=UPI00286DE73C|nr:nucleoside-diphosphate sugar epimerase/dehydratase [Sphingomonas sp.]